MSSYRYFHAFLFRQVDLARAGDVLQAECEARDLATDKVKMENADLLANSKVKCSSHANAPETLTFSWVKQMPLPPKSKSPWGKLCWSTYFRKLRNEKCAPSSPLSLALKSFGTLCKQREPIHSEASPNAALHVFFPFCWRQCYEL